MNLTLLLQRARQAKHKSGKGLVAQALEFARLRKAGGQLGPSEYFDYHLYNDNLFDEHAKREFIGWNGECSINDTFNKVEWAGLSLDKIVFYTFLEGAGIPYPRIQAIFDVNGRFMQRVPTISTPESLGQFLRDDATYPVFVKPSHGNFGRGAQFLSRYQSQDHSLLFSDGAESPVSEFIDSLETRLSGGQIFQDVFQPHPDLAKRCGLRSSTMRMVVIATKDGPRLCRAVWKIPTGNNIIDNFQHGRTGNFLAAVNSENGDVQRIIGQGSDGEFTTVTTHPNTNQPLCPFTIPDWPKIRDLCLTAACLLPGLRLLHFDIALSDRGPLLLEVNFRGNLDLLQHASGRGFLSPEVASAIQDHAAFRREIAEVVQKTMEAQQSSSGA